MIYHLEKEMWKDEKESVIRTEAGSPVLRLEPFKRMLRRKIRVYDRYHVPIGLIEKKVFKSGLHYDIIYDERVIATLSKSWSFFSRRYVLKTVGGPKFKIRGNIKEFNYKITRGKSTFARAFSDPDIPTNKFAFEAKKNEYRYALICCAIILTLIT